ncbi:Hypothetical protein PBC10988_28010 [Planctomycetales bacterium 10988]|nr:Hypothetical protein PBC10988_28010 [Planctomycetales bacterium 10988]
MEPYVQEMPRRLYAGREIRTCNANESNPETGKIGPLWQTLRENPFEDRIPKTASDTFYGIHFDYENGSQGDYSLIAGVEVDSLEKLPEDLAGITVPETKCLVFPFSGDLPDSIIGAWQRVWSYFAQDKAPRRAYSYDVEHYYFDEECSGEIFISVQ